MIPMSAGTHPEASYWVLLSSAAGQFLFAPTQDGEVFFYTQAQDIAGNFSAMVSSWISRIKTAS